MVQVAKVTANFMTCVGNDGSNPAKEGMTNVVNDMDIALPARSSQPMSWSKHARRSRLFIRMGIWEFEVKMSVRHDLHRVIFNHIELYWD